MHRIYQLAAELNLPVLLHIGGDYNSGIDRFGRSQELPQSEILGHATGWWANISSQVTPGVGYPKGPVSRGASTTGASRTTEPVRRPVASGLTALTRDDRCRQVRWSGTAQPAVSGGGRGGSDPRVTDARSHLTADIGPPSGGVADEFHFGVAPEDRSESVDAAVVVASDVEQHRKVQLRGKLVDSGASPGNRSLP